MTPIATTTTRLRRGRGIDVDDDDAKAWEGFAVQGFRGKGLRFIYHIRVHTADGQNPALPRIRNIP